MAENTFEALGFLADLPDDRAARRARFAEAFAACERLAQDGGKIVRYLGGCRLLHHQLVAVAMWVRCIAAAQGTVLLAERGMPAEAAALTRSCLESMFWGVALLKDAQALQWLAENDRAESRKMANGMLKHLQVAENLTEADRELLLSKSAAERTATTKVAAVAKLAELDYLYESAYRGLSRMGVHAGLASAVFSIHDNRVRLAPSDEQIPLILGAVIQGVNEGVRRFGAFALALAPASSSTDAVSTPGVDQ